MFDSTVTTKPRNLTAAEAGIFQSWRDDYLRSPKGRAYVDLKMKTMAKAKERPRLVEIRDAANDELPKLRELADNARQSRDAESKRKAGDIFGTGRYNASAAQAEAECAQAERNLSQSQGEYDRAVKELATLDETLANYRAKLDAMNAGMKAAFTAERDAR